MCHRRACISIEQVRLLISLVQSINHSNSLKFTTVGFVRISLKRPGGQEVGGMGDTILISVSDSGCGISSHHYDSLFSKWEQLGSRTNGTGIGLCLCQALIRVMGGHISLNRDYLSGIEGHPVCRQNVLALVSCFVSLLIPLIYFSGC